MQEQLNSKRLIFPKNEQSIYLQQAKQVLGVTWPEFANKLNIHPRVLNDWKREKYSIPEKIGLDILTLSGVQIPQNTERRSQFWYTSKGGIAAGKIVYEKHGRIGGDPNHRLEKWNKWWEESNHQNNLGVYATQKNILFASKSIRLAELFGIIIGDGGITKRQVKITLDSETDKDYVPFVVNIFTELFGVAPSIRKCKSRAVDIIVSRTSLVDYLETLDLPPGHKIKRQINIPEWILNNSEFSRACIRGLMDTDGSIFIENHTIKDRIYSYPRLWFVSASKPLRESVFKILAEAGFSPKVRSERAVTLEKRDDIVVYFNTIGTSNPKHRKRYVEIMEKCVSGRNRRS
jgi:hypothetical protein